MCFFSTGFCVWSCIWSIILIANPIGCSGGAAVLTYLAVHPPSMRIVSPVIRDAALEARNTTTPATSIGSPIRCSAAIRSITSERNSGLARQLSVPGVRMNVGATAFTVMLLLPALNSKAFGQMCNGGLLSCTKPTRSAAQRTLPGNSG
jgi:hypothetical protein